MASIFNVPCEKTSEDSPFLAEVKKALSVFNATAPLQDMEEDRYFKCQYKYQNSTNQRALVMDWFDQNGSILSPSKKIRCLSIGCGQGIMDRAFVASLVKTFGEGNVEMVGVDPNSVMCQHFRDLMTEEERKYITIEHSTMEEYTSSHPDERFDIIWCVHTLYYVHDAKTMVKQATDFLSPGGTFLVVHTAMLALNQMSVLFWEKQFCGRIPLFSKDIQNLASQYEGVSVDVHTIHAALDVTPVVGCYSEVSDPKNPRRLEMEDDAQMVLDFITQTNLLKDCGPETSDLAAAYINQIASPFREMNGRRTVHHPVDLIMIRRISPSTQNGGVDEDSILGRNLSFYKDGLNLESWNRITMIDYDQLFAAFNWVEHIAEVAVEKGKTKDAVLRIFDVGCGTGRFPRRLQPELDHALTSKESAKIIYDVLDPSPYSAEQIWDSIHAPFLKGKAFVTTIQEWPIPEYRYDLIYAVHSVYTLKKNEFGKAALKMVNALSPKGKAFIYHPSDESFYCQYFKLFGELFGGGADFQPYLTAEEIVDELERIGLYVAAVKQPVLHVVKRDDDVGLARYLSQNAYQKRSTLEWFGPQLMREFLEAYLDEGGENYVFRNYVWLIEFSNSQ